LLAYLLIYFLYHVISFYSTIIMAYGRYAAVILVCFMSLLSVCHCLAFVGVFFLPPFHGEERIFIRNGATGN